MKCFYACLTLVLFIALNTSAQKEADNWYFGNNAGVTFKSGTPVPFYNGALNTSEGCSSISDSSGNILLYTNGVSVWNRLDSIMPNGTGLLGDISTTQSALVVPQPGSSAIYYIFTAANDGNTSKGFRYSIVDMTLDGGLGDITATKNILLFDSSTEKISAVKHSGNGVWIMGHQWGSDAFYAYDLTAGGLNITPVISHTGTVHTATSTSVFGQMKFSPGGKKIGVAIGYQNLFEVFDFNDTTGIVSNPIALPVIDHTYGLEFSPNGTRLYVTHYDNINDYYYLDQYDLTAGNAVAINASSTNLGANFDPTNNFRALQVAPDGKIYVAKTFQEKIGVINFPDSLGVASYFVDNAVVIDTTGVHFCELGLPGFVQSYFQEKMPIAALTQSDTIACLSACINFTDLSLNNPSSWQWYFPGGNPAFSPNKNPGLVCYDTSGTYNVMLIVTNSLGADTIIKKKFIKILPQQTGGIISSQQDTVCANTKMDLKVKGNSGTVQWQSSLTPGNFTDIAGADSTTHSLIAVQTTYFRVTVNGNCPAVSDTFKLNVIPGPVAIFTVKYTGGLTVSFNSDSSKMATSFFWDFGDNTFSTAADTVHTYATDSFYDVCLTVKNQSNCDYVTCQDVVFEGGINNINKQGTILIYPNPFTNQLFIHQNTSGARIESVEMYDVVGRKVISKQIENRSPGDLTLDVPLLAKGMYFIRVRTSDTEIIQPMIKD